jgi:hypothetical protein
MTQAWRERDAASYIAMFAGTTRDAASAADMFTRIEQSGAQFQINVREDPDSRTVLFFEIASEAEGYAQKTFEFSLGEAGLVWNARSQRAGVSNDPLWVIAGEAYGTLVARLVGASGDEIDGIESEFRSGLEQDMSNDERERVERWIAALRSAGQFFEPASSEFLCGFPMRATLRKSAAEPMMFHLMTMPSSPTNLVYIQEREVQVADIQGLWPQTSASRKRGNQPWRLWSEIVGAPPRNQVVGLTLAEAAELANGLACEIPTLAEWRSAVRQIPDAKAMDFVGGVWELCSDSAGQSAATIAGGCWHDQDAEVLAAGMNSPPRRSGLGGGEIDESRTGPALFGTIGFRLCKRFSIPSEALAAARSE